MCSKGNLALGALGRVNGNGKNLYIISNKRGSLSTERSELIRSPTCKALGEESQQQVLLPA